jgi:hypothetical protein
MNKQTFLKTSIATSIALSFFLTSGFVHMSYASQPEPQEVHHGLPKPKKGKTMPKSTEEESLYGKNLDEILGEDYSSASPYHNKEKLDQLSKQRLEKQKENQT